MKTAISIPDETFDHAERLARRLRISRSRLYSRALDEYIARHDPDAVTEAIDRVCDSLDTSANPFLQRAARRVLGDSEW